jgi:hypothetical protein
MSEKSSLSACPNSEGNDRLHKIYVLLQQQNNQEEEEIEQNIEQENDIEEAKNEEEHINEKDENNYAQEEEYYKNQKADLKNGEDYKNNLIQIHNNEINFESSNLNINRKTEENKAQIPEIEDDNENEKSFEEKKNNEKEYKQEHINEDNEKEQQHYVPGRSTADGHGTLAMCRHTGLGTEQQRMATGVERRVRWLRSLRCHCVGTRTGLRSQPRGTMVSGRQCFPAGRSARYRGPQGASS